MTEIERRTAQVAEVNFPKRQIELIVMPYESETTIDRPGRSWTEVVSRGAFEGVELRTSRIRVNRDHNIGDVVGKTVALHPSRAEGLVAELELFPTDRGEETLILADQGGLDASAGFGLLRKNGRSGPVVPHAEVWEARDRRRLNHLFLHHIAMTPDGAYEDARVLAVRTANDDDLEELVGGTPNLDRMRLAEDRARMADLDRRYGLSR
jgi:phage head maturation protease